MSSFEAFARESRAAVDTMLDRVLPRPPDCPAIVDRWAEAALAVKPEAIILVHGGPVAEPADADFIMKNTRHCHGFYGASSMERLPVEAAIRDQTRAFKTISRKGGKAESPAGTNRRSSAAR